MTHTIKADPSGQLCVYSDAPDEHGNPDKQALVLNYVWINYVTGHLRTEDPQKHALAALSPKNAEKLQECAEIHPPAALLIFAGERPVE